MTGAFYVYTLSDPRTGQVFYVGKGQKERAWHHVRSVRKGRTGSNKAKEDRIKEILALDLTPLVQIAHRFDSEQDALDTEADLIASLSGLTNIMAGGGKAMTPEQARKRMDERQARIRLAKVRKTEAELRQFVARVSTWPGATFPCIKDGDRKASEFIRDLKALLSKVDASRPGLIHG